MSVASTRPGKNDTDPHARQTAPNRPNIVSEAIKALIMDQGMEPGDRLPQEPSLIKIFGVSKGTIREALKMLETQGLIQTRTGPGGGAFITDMPASHASALMSNYFFFKNLSISDIYEIRQALEPELAAELATHLGEKEFNALENTMIVYDHPPTTTEEEQLQRIAELEFHERLAGFSTNPLLAFICGFLVSLLKDLAVCKRIYRNPNPELRERGYSYQGQLIEAMRVGDTKAAHSIMKAHMISARRLMTEQEAIVNRGFLSLGNKKRSDNPPGFQK